MHIITIQVLYLNGNLYLYFTSVFCRKIIFLSKHIHSLHSPSLAFSKYPHSFMYSPLFYLLFLPLCFILCIGKLCTIQMRKKDMYMSEFIFWDNEVHKSVDQIKRIISARKIKSSEIEIDQLSESATIKGSGSNPYHVTLNSCTCFDFESRKLPCKHIYRLASELGCGPALKSLDKKSSKAFTDSIPSEINRFYQLYESGAISAEKFTKIAAAIQSGK